MKAIDIILLIIVIGILITSGYFGFIKHRKSPCKGCPHAKNCVSGSCENTLKSKAKKP